MLKIIIGDHHCLFREALAEWLGRQPDVVSIHEAGTSDQTIDLVCREHPDLVFMDCELPGRDPFEAVLEIRRIVPDCKVLFLAERQYDAHVEAVLACGANGYLPKHEPLSALRETMTRVLNGERVLSKPLADRLVVKEGRWLLSKPQSGAFARLTDREWDLLRHLACGETLKQASAIMNITYKAADNLKTNITRKLDIHDRVELARFAMREGVVCPSGPDDHTLRRISGSSAERFDLVLQENSLPERASARIG